MMIDWIPDLLCMQQKHQGHQSAALEATNAVQTVHVAWMGGDAEESAELYAKSYMLRWPKYRSLANACLLRVCEQEPTGFNNGYDRQ